MAKKNQNSFLSSSSGPIGSPVDNPPEQGALSQGRSPGKEWRGAMVTRLRLQNMRRLKNQGIGHAEDLAHLKKLKSRKRTTVSQEWQGTRVLKTTMALKIVDARRDYEEAKQRKSEARYEMTKKFGKKSMKLKGNRGRTIATDQADSRIKKKRRKRSKRRPRQYWTS